MLKYNCYLYIVYCILVILYVRKYTSKYYSGKLVTARQVKSVRRGHFLSKEPDTTFITVSFFPHTSKSGGKFFVNVLKMTFRRHQFILFPFERRHLGQQGLSLSFSPATVSLG